MTLHTNAEGTLSLPPAPVAASLIPQIKDAHKASMDANNSALNHAIRCGELLIKAKETVKSVGGKWEAWPEAHCPFSQETASMYMRLAAGQDIIADDENQERVTNLAKEGKLTIRSAVKLLPKAKPRGKTKEAKAKPKAEPAFADHDLADTLRAVAPDEVFKALRDTFDRDQLALLTNLLADHLLKAEAQP